MKANRKYIEGEQAVSAVIGVILMVAITVAIAATVYVYVAGLASTPSNKSESASVVVKNDASKIKITLTMGGNNMPTAGYAWTSVVIRCNGQVLPQTGLTATSWPVGGQLFIGLSGTPAAITLDDDASALTALAANSYSVTVVIADTVVYDDSIRIV